MQVKISFTVALDDVPKKVDEALLEAVRQIEVVRDGRMAITTKDNVIDTMLWIDRARKQLLSVDTRLMECYSILAGYNKAIAESMMPQEDTPPVESENVES